MLQKIIEQYVYAKNRNGDVPKVIYRGDNLGVSQFLKGNSDLTDINADVIITNRWQDLWSHRDTIETMIYVGPNERAPKVGSVREIFYGREHHFNSTQFATGENIVYIYSKDSDIIASINPVEATPEKVEPEQPVTKPNGLGWFGTNNESGE